MKKLLLPLAFISFSSYATVDPLPKHMAKPATNTEAKTYNSAEYMLVKKKKPSKEYRKEKEFTLTAGLFGVEHDATATAIEFGKFIDSNNVLSLRYSVLESGFLNFSYSTDDEVQDEYDKHNTGYTLTLSNKRFVGNSFYMKYGTYYRNQRKVYDVDSDYSYDNNGTLSYSISDIEGGVLRDIGFKFKIGNQWQLSGFTIGCDWVGANATVFRLDNESEIKDFENFSVSVLNFYLGASF